MRKSQEPAVYWKAVTKRPDQTAGIEPESGDKTLADATMRPAAPSAGAVSHTQEAYAVIKQKH
jgi:hypothetical protein